MRTRIAWRLGLSVVLAGGLACKQPKPASGETAKKDTIGEVSTGKFKEDTEGKASEEARLKAEEEARIREEEARRKAQQEGGTSEDIKRAAASVLKDIHFAFDRYSIQATDRKTLEAIAAFMKKHLGVKLTVEGHCDERGTVEYNLALGEKRANAAIDYLKGLGVARDRFTTISYGKERPLCSTSSEGCWQKNRRVSFAVKG